jgi:hypothetical protein
MRKWLKISGITAILVITSWLAYAAMRDRWINHRYNRVSEGMTQQQVVSVMGRPDRTGPCGELGGSPDGCVFEYLYFPRSLTITAWAVFFDKSGNVVGRYYYVSY